MSVPGDVQDEYLGTLAEGVWLVDHPECPRCGLRLHKDDPMEGYRPVEGGPMKLMHLDSVYTDSDGCIVGLGRAMVTMNDRVAALERRAGL